MKKKFSIFVSVLMFCLLLSSMFVKADEYLEKAEEFDQTVEEYQSASEVFGEEEVEELIKQVETKPLMPDKTDFTVSDENKIPVAIGQYPRRKGVILVTTDKYMGIVPTGHAAIIYDYYTVVESLLEEGVTTGENNWDESKGTCYAVTVKRTTAEQDRKAADWCYAQLGKPYNISYFDMLTREKFYCSQLVWAAFFDNFGINLDTEVFSNRPPTINDIPPMKSVQDPPAKGNAIHPMELVWSYETWLMYEK